MSNSVSLTLGTVGATTVALSWSATLDTGWALQTFTPLGGDPCKLNVTRRLGSGYWSTHTHTTDTTPDSWTDTGLTTGANYQYRISCIIKKGSVYQQLISPTIFVTPVAATTPWVKTMLSTPGAHRANGWCVTTDAAANVIVGGDFNGTVDFGGGVISTSVSTYDAFIAKYTAQGSLLWKKTFGGIMDQTVKAVSVDSQNNIIAVGLFCGTVDFGGTTLTAPDPYSFWASDMFVAKYSPVGSLIWVRQFGGGQNDIGIGVAVDGSDNIIFTGRLGSQNVDFGNDIILSSAGSFDVVLVKLLPAGTTVWAKRYGGKYPDAVNALAVDSSGDVVITGQFAISTDLGGGEILGGPSYSTFVAKYSGTDGHHLWSKGFGNSTIDGGNGITVDPSTGNVIVAGSFKDTANFDGGQTPNNSTKTGQGQTPYIVAYSSIGTFLWVKVFGGGGGTTDWCTAVAMTPDGHLAVTGSKGNSWFLPGPWPNGTWYGNVGFFIMTFTVSGNAEPVLDRFQFPVTGSTGGSTGNGIVYDSSGKILFAGWFNNGTVDFGGVSATTIDSTYSGFLVKYSPTDLQFST
jgi:hypothetical protein